jgi:hypothetical protein
LEESRDKFLLECAVRYVEDKAADLLRSRGDAASAAEIAEGLELGKSLPMRLVRGILMASTRFRQDGRVWRLAPPGSDPTMSAERVVAELILARGKPVSVDDVVRDFAATRDVLEEDARAIVESMVRVSPEVVVLAGGELAHRSWLLEVPTGDEQDVRFVNFRGESSAELDLFLAVAGNGRRAADPVGTVSSAIEKAGLPISTRVAAFLAWRRDPEGFDASEFLAKLSASKKLQVLSSGHWFVDALLADFERAVKRFKVPDKVAAEAGPEARDGIEVQPRDIEEVERIIIEEEKAISSRRILERYFDYVSSDKGYEKALKALSAALAADGRFIKVGEDSWHIKDLIPSYIFEIPAPLEFERVSGAVVDIDELDVVDPIITDEGYEGTLKEDVLDPYAEDVGDCDFIATADSAGRARCMTKYHHVSAGTLPLCQIPLDFFPMESEVSEGTITVIDERGDERKKLMDIDVWVNRTLMLIYGVSRLYDQNLARVGQVFYFERGSGSDNWRIELTEEVDPDISLSPKRIAELEAMRTMAAEEPWSLFQIVREVLTFHRSGASFPRIMTEVGIVRRARRAEVASILSSYHCFYAKGDHKLWNYDERKLSQGFKKSKRKYLQDEA